MNITIEKNDKLLVVSPHQDDESIGCGGLLSLYGKQCDVLLVSDGRNGIDGENDYKKVISIRNREMKEALNLANVNNYFHLDIENDKVTEHKSTIKEFNIQKYDYVFVPNRYETHADHNCLLKTFVGMKKKQKAKCKLFEYEVWTPLRNPTWILDIEKVASNKRKMISVYKSQLENTNYVDAGMGLSSYRGMSINSKYAEAYQDYLYDGVKAYLYNLLPNTIKELVKKILK